MDHSILSSFLLFVDELVIVHLLHNFKELM